ncbi:MAG: cytidylate kinase-like family protein [Muribaculaceae bacterium]|nr:cytidylate kinase-like family protein [Muribaculaceae bacterium]
MNKNNSVVSEYPEDKFVIVIGREFGSGGRRVGKILADKLGCSYYDNELLSEAARAMGFSKEIFNAHDEKKPSPFNTFLQGVYGIPSNFHDTSVGGSSLYRAQSNAIKNICRKNSCVIVGRTADYVLRDHPGMISVFLHSPLEHRAVKIIERGDALTKAQAFEIARRHDRNRESYYNYYTGRHWGRASNYHLSIDASLLKEEEIADIIIAFLNAKRRHI